MCNIADSTLAAGSASQLNKMNGPIIIYLARFPVPFDRITCMVRR